MKIRTLVLVLLSAVAVALPGISSAQTHDTWYGTWKLDPSQSTCNPAPCGPMQLQTIKLEPSKDGMKQTTDTAGKDGQNSRAEVKAKFDGKDYPVPGAVGAYTYAFQRIDEHTYERVTKKDGQIVATVRSVVSEDGKTRSQTTMGKNSQGESVAVATFVFTRQ